MCDLREVILIGDTISIDNDQWEDAGKRFKVKEIMFRPDTTAVTVELIDEQNNIHRRVVPYSQLYKVT